MSRQHTSKNSWLPHKRVHHTLPKPSAFLKQQREPSHVCRPLYDGRRCEWTDPLLCSHLRSLRASLFCRSPGFLQRLQSLDQLLEFLFPVRSRRPNRRQHLPDPAPCLKQSASNVCPQQQLLIPQLAKQVLPGMRLLFQLLESQESARTFDRVNAAKYSRQKFHIGWLCLQLHQIPVKTVEVLIAFHQKFLDQFIHGQTPS